MTWSVLPASVFPRFTQPWDSLNERLAHSNPLLDSRLVAPLLENFSKVSDGIVLAIYGAVHAPSGMALLQPMGRGRWELFAPGQAPLGPLLLSDDLSNQDKGEAMRELHQALPFPALLIGLVNQDSDCASHIAVPPDQRSESLPHAITTRLRLESNFSTYWSARSKKLQGNMRRRLQRLESEGIATDLKVLSSSADIVRGVGEYGDLETSGWKGREGTALHRNNPQGRFYADVLHRFSETGNARVYQLFFNSQLVGSRLAVLSSGTLVMLKKTHDESYSSLAPGRVLDYLLLQQLFSENPRSVRTIEFYTNASEEDIKWSTETRPIVHTNHYRFAWLHAVVRQLNRLRSSRGHDTSASAADKPSKYPDG